MRGFVLDGWRRQIGAGRIKVSAMKYASLILLLAATVIFGLGSLRAIEPGRLLLKESLLQSLNW